MKKKILIGIGVLAVLIVVGVGIVAANLDKIINSRKGELLALAKKQTGREITIGDVGVTLWPGLGARVSDVVVSDDPEFSPEPFVRAKELVVSVKFLPLLKKRVEIKRLVLNEPNIIVIKRDAKTFNFTSLVTAATPPDTTGKKAASNSSMAAVLAFADIKDGTLRYADRMTGVDRTIRDIDFTASNVGIGNRMDATLEAAVFGDAHDVRVIASAGPLGDPASKEALAGTPLDVSVELSPVAITTLMSAAARPGQPAPTPIPGDVRAKAKLSGTIGAASLDELAVSAALLGAEDPNLTLTASGGPFDFTADSTLVFANAVLRGKLETEPFPLAELKLKSNDPKVPPPVLGGEMRADATFEGNLTALAFDGNIDATSMSFEQKDGLTKAPGIPATAKVRGRFHPQNTPGEGIDFDKIDVVFHALTATGSGRMVPFKGHEALDLTLDAKTALKPWNELMPAMAPFEVSGDATVNVRVSGMPTPEKPSQVTGTARLKNVSAKIVEMPKPVSDGTATVAFTDKTANIDDAQFRIGESRFYLDLAVTSFKPMQAHYTVSSAEVRRPDVQAPVANAKPFPRPEVFKNVVATGNLRETAPKVNENEVVVTSERGTVANIDYVDLVADLTVTPELTTIKRYRARAMGGSISGSGTMEPKISKFDISTKVEDVNLAEYFKYKSPELAGVLVGRLNADMKIGGQGKEWEEIQKTLTGDGGALVIEGALLNVNIANQIISSIEGMPMVPQDLTQRMKVRNPKLFAENQTVFKNLSSKFTIANGRIQAPDLKLATSDFALSGDGWFSMTKELSLKSTLTLSQKVASDLVAEVPAAKYILSPDGRIDVPLSFSGPLMKPRIQVDTAAMTAKFQKAMLSQGQQDLQNKARSTVKGLLDGLGKPKAPATKPAPPDTTKQ